MRVVALALGFVVVGAAGLAVLVAGVAYQRLGRRRDWRLMQGELVDIGGGRSMYAVRKGQGEPAVVFEAGFAATSLNWMAVQEQMARSAETVAYDRCGLGWSTGSREARTPGKIAAELRAMLRAMGVAAPYVLVGHSFGGLVMRRFALDYPAEVAGVVLVDPMRTGEWPPVSDRQRAMVDRAWGMTGLAVQVARVGLARLAVRSLLCREGWVSGVMARVSGRSRRLLDRLTEEVGKMPKETRPAVAAHWANPDFYKGMRAHLAGLMATVEEMHGAEAIKGVPVVVLTPVSAEALSEEELARIGVGARQVIAERSKHWIHLDEPELVVAAILEVRGSGVSAVVG